MELRVVSPDTDGAFQRARGLTLAEIASRFASPLTEEQAWAVCHQCARRLLQSGEKRGYPASVGALPSLDMNSVAVSVEGAVELLWEAAAGGEKQTCLGCYQDCKQLLLDLGILIYSLLDYGITEDRERRLSSPLESLIEWLTNEEDTNDADSDSDVDLDSLCNSPGTRDSGINEDCILLGMGPWEGLLDVVKSCECHVPDSEVLDPGGYYRAVCKTMVEEAVEIRALQEKDKGNSDSKLNSVDAQTVNNWQLVMKDLEKGVHLTHVPESEMSVRAKPQVSKFDVLLMSISNFDKSKLQPVMADGSPSRHCQSVSNDDALLEEWLKDQQVSVRQTFLRARRATLASLHSCLMLELKTRPALRPVSERSTRRGSLVPRPLTPMECLMREILTPPILRKVERDSPRRLARSPSHSSIRHRQCPSGDRPPGVFDSNSSEQVREKPPLGIPRDYNEGIQKWCPSWNLNTTPHAPPTRRHRRPYSVSSIRELESAAIVAVCDNLYGDASRGRARKVSAWSSHNDIDHTLTEEMGLQTSDNDSEVFTEENSAECSSAEDSGAEHQVPKLSLLEVVHIRTISASGDLISLQQEDAKFSKQLEKGKVCFACRKKKFSVFTRSTACHICKRQVCSGCIRKHRGPLNNSSGSATSKSTYICGPCWEFLTREDFVITV